VPEPIQQASAIPFRRRGDALEFCLITSASGNRWGFPKGIIEGGDSPEATALNEAREEAGLHGRIIGEPLGTYRYQKWGTVLDVVVFLMEVDHVDDDWQESGLRERVWVNDEDALSRIDRDELVAFLRRAVERIGGPQRA
jgi:8-oxo-dGTP pyrophosphatase MutT (NUDIX family)